ncbi:hypothetical protein [Nocardioides alkalitolerans]|uniref:hypothetical protein n=1 Tax=Nocardioides alkalitolerans TaxID=281714 RepID=UPI0004057B56|nr:hypothetical protein [Nocardioides alkalitolerans]
MSDHPHQAVPEGKYEVSPAEWALVLSDWKRSDANVTVHLRGGISVGPGKVTNIPGGVIASGGLRAAARSPYGDPDRRWTFDVREVIAVTAEAAR